MQISNEKLEQMERGLASMALQLSLLKQQKLEPISIPALLVSKSKAARIAGVSRTTIHRYVNDGRVHSVDGKVDASSLAKVFGQAVASGKLTAPEPKSFQPSGRKKLRPLRCRKGKQPKDDVRMSGNIRRDLFIKLKIEAAQRRTTIGQIVEELAENHFAAQGE